MNIWQELGIAPTQDLRAIKRAYAKRLRQVHPEEDAEGFQQLRLAYERAQGMASKEAPPATNTATPVADALKLAAKTAPQPALRPAMYAAEAVVSTRHEGAEEYRLPPAEIGADLAERFFRGWLNDPIAPENRLRHQLSWQVMQSLVVRERFEHSLLQRLLSLPELPVDLIEACVTLCGWSDLRHPLWREGLRVLIPRLEAAQTELKLRAARQELAQIRAGARGTRAQRNALLALLGPVRSLRFRWLALFQENREAVANALEQLQRLGPEFFAQETQAQAVAWWRERLSLGRITGTQWLALLLLGLFMAGATVLWLSETRLLGNYVLSHRLAWALSAITLWWSLIAVSVAMFLRMRQAWKQEGRRRAERLLARLRHERQPRNALIALFLSLLATVVAVSAPLPRVIFAELAYALLFVGFGRLGLRWTLSALPWAVAGGSLLASTGLDGLGSFLVAHLLAIAACCGGTLLLHDRLVRRGLSSERIQYWLRWFVRANWIAPLALLIVIDTFGLVAMP